MERSNSSSSVSSIGSNATIRGASSNPQPSQSYIKSPIAQPPLENHASSGEKAEPNQAGENQSQFQTPLRRGGTLTGQGHGALGANGMSGANGNGGGNGQQSASASSPLRTAQTPQHSDNSPQTPQSQAPPPQGFGSYRIPDRANDHQSQNQNQNQNQALSGGLAGAANMQFNFSSGIPYPGQKAQNQAQSVNGQGQGSNQNGQGQGQGQGGQGEPWGAPFPALHLWPLNETFVMKMIALPRDQRIKIGRQTNAKTVPGERNGYFDSKVLSRMHAELWEEGGKIFIRDVKSSNGTFINGDRLSGEGVESEPFELKSEDMVEFGIDIVSEDNKSILHHKVSAKAYCVFNVDDAGASARERAHYYPHDPRTSMGPARRIAGLPGPQTSNSLGPNGQVLTNNMLSAGGKIPGLNFDHLLHKLQMELQKSQDTGEELRGLTEAMEGIQETLSGAIAPDQNGSADHHIPPQFRIPPAQPVGGVPVVAMGDTTATIAALQAQLSSTQSILVSHKDRIKSLESLLQEHEAIKDEVLGMRRQMEESKHEIDSLLKASEKAAEDAAIALAAQDALEEEGQDGSGSEADGRRARGLEREQDESTTPDQRDEEEDIADGGRRHHSVPSTPTGSVGLSHSRTRSPSPPSSREDQIVAQNRALGARLDALSDELDQALQLSRSLHDQHAAATSAVKILEERVQSLERDVAEKTDAAGKSGRAAEDRWEVWRTKFEEGWRKERESWNLERERLRGVVREWEEASRRAQEEEEERSMNSKLSDDEALLSDSDEDDEGSDFEEENDQVLARTDWLGTGYPGSDQETRLNGVSLHDVPRRSHSASPRSSRSGGKSGRYHRSSTSSRRSSSNRLDPAIKALRAAAGSSGKGDKQVDFDGKRERFGGGGSTPRNGSPTTADQALGALRNRSARAERAKTITGRRPGKSTDSDGANDGNTTEPPSGSKGRTKSALSKTIGAATVKQRGVSSGSLADGDVGSDADGDKVGEQTPVGEGHSTSGESDETAHDLTGEEKQAGEKEGPKPGDETKAVIPPNQSVIVQNQLPLVISVVVISVGVWAVLNRAKD